MPERLKAFTHVHEMPWHWALTDHTYLASHDGKTWQAFYHIFEFKPVERIFPQIDLCGTAQEVESRLSDYYG